MTDKVELEKKAEELAGVLKIDVASARKILEIKARLSDAGPKEDRLLEGCLVKMKELRDKTTAIEEEYRILVEVLEALMDGVQGQADICDDLTAGLDEIKEALEQLQVKKGYKK
jgi:hypothetical protein